MIGINLGCQKTTICNSEEKEKSRMAKEMTNEKAIEMLEYIRRTGNGESEYKNDAQAIAIDMAIKALAQQPAKCTWIKYDYRTMCPKDHDVDNPYWRIPENRMKALKYCPYCGKEIEVSE